MRSFVLVLVAIFSLAGCQMEVTAHTETPRGFYTDREKYDIVQNDLGHVLWATRAQILRGERDYTTEHAIGGYWTRCYKTWTSGVLYAKCTTEWRLEHQLQAIHRWHDQGPPAKLVLQHFHAYGLAKPVFMEPGVAAWHPPMRTTLEYHQRNW